MTLLKKIIYKNYLIFFLNSILCSFVINSILDNNLQLNFFYKNYIAGLPVKFSYILGFYFLTLKIFVVSFLVLSILIYIKEKIKFYIAKDNAYFLKVLNYLLLFSNISYIANIFSNNIFEGPVIDKVVNFTYLHFFIFSIIYFVHFKYKFFKFNIKDDFFLFKILFSISVLFIFQYLFGIFFQDYFIWKDGRQVFDHKFLRFIFRYIDLVYLIFIYLLLLLLNKLNKSFIETYSLIIFTLPLIIKLSFAFSNLFLIALIFIYIFNKYLRFQSSLYFCIIFFIINLFLPLNILLEHRSNFNYLGEGIFSMIALLSNEFASDYGYPFGFYKNYLQALLPYYFFGISIDSLSYSVLFCRSFEILLVSLIIYEISGLKFLLIFLILLISNFFNFFPTDFTAPWTHEYRLLPYYIFLYNFVFFFKYKNNNSFFYLGVTFGYMSLSTFEFLIPLILILLLLILFYYKKKFRDNIVIKSNNNFALYSYNFFNFFLICYYLTTLYSLSAIKLFNYHNILVIFLAQFSLVLIFLIIVRNFNNSFLKLLSGFLLIYFSGIYTAYVTGHLDPRIISGYANYMKLVGGYDEIAREWKTSAKLIYDYFITGVISENLSQLISNMNSYAVLSNKYDKIFLFQNFSLSTFLFFYSHYFYFTLIGFLFLFFYFNNKSYQLNAINKINLLLIFICAIFSFTLFTKYYLLPDPQRFLMGTQFYHLSLFFLLSFFLRNFFKKHINKTFVIIFFISLIPNFFFYKTEAYYNKNANQANLKNFSYQTTSLGELSNHFKTIIIKNNDFYVKKGTNSMVNIAEITYGPNVYSETKTELDLYHKFNFIPKNFENKKINFWSKNKIINNIYLR
jgi:hypothetical protein